MSHELICVMRCIPMWDMHICSRWMSHVVPSNDSHHTNQRVRSYLSMSHVTHINEWNDIYGVVRWVGSLQLQVSSAEHRLFYRALLQKRPIILRSLLIVATPYRQISSHIIRLCVMKFGIILQISTSLTTYSHHTYQQILTTYYSSEAWP